MASNIRLGGAIYPEVPAIELKSDIGNTVRFVDTSDGNAIAEDIAKGKVAYVDGSRIVGVSEGSSDSGMNIQAYHGMKSVRGTSYAATGVKLTVEKSGTYKISWMGFRNNASSSTWGSQLYINGNAYGSASTAFTSSYGQQITLNNVVLNEGQNVEVWARSRSTSYYMYVGMLVLEQVS